MEKDHEFYQIIKENTEAMRAVKDGLADQYKASEKQKGILIGIKEALTTLGDVMVKATNVGRELTGQKKELESVTKLNEERHKNVVKELYEVKQSFAQSNCQGHEEKLNSLSDKVKLNRETDKDQNKNTWQMAVIAITIVLSGLVQHFFK